MAKTVFQRTEKKYRLDAKQYEAVLAGLPEHMHVDNYGSTTICSVYYDDQCDRMIRASIQRPVYKEKLRVRSYGIPGQDSIVYIELKKKFKGVVYKRRAGMTLREAEAFLAGGQPPGEPTQIIREITWVRDFYKPSPRAFIAYDRIALVSESEPQLRITFDSDIRARSGNLSLSAGDHGVRLLPEGERIMEIKAPGAMPLWLCSLLGDLNIYPTRFSKYGTYYLRLAAQNRSEKTLTNERETSYV